METIANRIKEGLALKNMKQADLVEKTGIGKSSISTYISGAYEPKQKNLYEIAKALNVNEEWLMGYDVPNDRNLGCRFLTSSQLQLEVEEKAFEDFINLISSAGYEITCIGNGMYEILSERYHWCFNISKEELYELDKSIMNYVCYTTDKFMSDKHDTALLKKINMKKDRKENIFTSTAGKKANGHELNAAHSIPGASEEDQQHDDDIMNDVDF